MSPVAPTPGPLESLQQIAERNRESEIVAQQEFTEWKENSGAGSLFESFAVERHEPNEESLRKYLEGRAEEDIPLTAFEADLEKALEQLTDTDHSTAEAARKNINLLLRTIAEREHVVEAFRRRREELAMDRGPEAAPVLTWTMEKAKKAVGGFTEAFVDAEGRDKLIMLGGAAAAFILARKLWSAARGGEGKKGWFGKIMGGAMGLGGIYLALEATNRAWERVSGRPVFTMETGLTLTQAQWEAAKHKREIKKAWELLRTSDLPNEVLAGLDEAGKERYGFALVNISGLTLGELQELYLAHKDERQIPAEVALYPAHPFADDRLAPADRFRIVEDIAKAAEVVDAEGVASDLDEQRKKKELLYVALDFADE